MIVTSSLSLSLSCACTRAPSDGSATDRLHKKKDHFKETRCAPVLVQNETPSTSPTMSSLCGSLQRPGSQIQPEEGLYDFFSQAFLCAPGCSLCVSSTRRADSQLQPDWRQTRRGETAHRSPTLQQLAAEGSAQNLERSLGRTRTGS